MLRIVRRRFQVVLPRRVDSPWARVGGRIGGRSRRARHRRTAERRDRSLREDAASVRCPLRSRRDPIGNVAADITVFDPATVIDRATFADPATPSEGIVYVIVNGVPVVRGGELVEGATPGQAIRRPTGLVP